MQTAPSQEGVYLLDYNQPQATGALVNHSNWSNRTALELGDAPFESLPYQLNRSVVDCGGNNG